MPVRLSRTAILAVAKRPDLWPTAVRVAVELAPRGWWRRRPFLPIPDQTWMHFRLETAYGGDGDAPMQAQDLLTFLDWKRDF